jgi:acyl-[acyl-carrier-protein]-phospholipid O-acyltransferase/long-chain-fatty-acid--[acyl-carrier-protein] ligase
MVPHGVVEQKIAELFAGEPGDGPAIVVVGVPDSAKGERLVALAAFDLDPAALRPALLAAGLPNLWIPKIVARVEKIPVLGTGKTDLRGCRELAQAAADQGRGDG